MEEEAVQGIAKTLRDNNFSRRAFLISRSSSQADIKPKQEQMTKVI